MSEVGNRKSCKCASCKGACKNTPGWFMPNEIPELAKTLNLSIKELFKKYLAINWRAEDGPIFVIAPALKSGSPGEEYSKDPRGICIFLDEQKEICKIHGHHPFGCKELLHSDSVEKSQQITKQVAEAWNNKSSQKLIRELLGRNPKAKKFTIFDWQHSMLQQLFTKTNFDFEPDNVTDNANDVLCYLCIHQAKCNNPCRLHKTLEKYFEKGGEAR